MSDYEIMTTRLTILPEGEPIFSESATHVEIDDEAAGEYVVVSQDGGKIQIMPEDWPKIRKAINKLIKQARF